MQCKRIPGYDEWQVNAMQTAKAEVAGFFAQAKADPLFAAEYISWFGPVLDPSGREVFIPLSLWTGTTQEAIDALKAKQAREAKP